MATYCAALLALIEMFNWGGENSKKNELEGDREKDGEIIQKRVYSTKNITIYFSMIYSTSFSFPSPFYAF